MAKKTESQGMTRTALLAGLIIAATAGAMVLFGGGGDDAGVDSKSSDSNASAVEDEVLRVSGVMVRDNIVSASWRERRLDRQEGDTTESTSMLDGAADPFGKKSERDSMAEKSLRETVDEIHGLGVYVVPAGEDEDEDGK